MEGGTVVVVSGVGVDAVSENSLYKVNVTICNCHAEAGTSIVHGQRGTIL